jgi:invasion protein IalB
MTRIMTLSIKSGAFLAASALMLIAGAAAADPFPPAAPHPAQHPRLAQAPAVTPAAPAVPAAPAAPQRTETITYDNWMVTCRDTVDGTTKTKKTCSAVLKLIEKDRNAVVFVWFIGHNAAGALLSVMQVPTGVLIQKGIEVKVDKGEARKLEYNSCTTQNCEATLVMVPAFDKQLIAGQTAVATIYAVDGRGINFNVPLKGIDKAIASIGR